MRPSSNSFSRPQEQVSESSGEEGFIQPSWIPVDRTLAAKVLGLVKRSMKLCKLLRFWMRRLVAGGRASADQNEALSYLPKVGPRASREGRA